MLGPQVSATMVTVSSADGTQRQERGGVLPILQAQVQRLRSQVCAVGSKAENPDPATRNTSHIMNGNEHGEWRNEG